MAGIVQRCDRRMALQVSLCPMPPSTASLRPMCSTCSTRIFPPLDRRGAPGFDSWWSALHGQPDPRYEGILPVRIPALVFRV